MQPISYYFFHEEENFHFIHSCGPKLKDEKEKKFHSFYVIWFIYAQ